MNTHPFVTAAIVGNAEHGKTTFTQCRAGINSDSCEARKQCASNPGMNITPIGLPSGARTASVVMPEHVDAEGETTEIFNRVDLARPVVAADLGVPHQTADHLKFLDHLKAHGGLAIMITEVMG